MAALVSCPKHNMVACLEKTEQNTQFHEIVDFFTRSLIYYSLTMSPTVSTSLIEQFWNTTTSKKVNDVSYIKAKVASKTISIFEASIRRDLQFNDVDGIDCLTNQEIYKNLQLMGYEGDLTILTFQKALFSPPWKPNTTQDPKENLEGTSRSQGDHVQIPHDSPLSGGRTSYRAEGGLNLDELLVLCTKLSNRVLALETSKVAQAVEILNLKTRIKKLEKKCKPSISHHRAWLRSVSRQRNETKELNLDAEDKGSGEKGGSTVSTSRPEVDTARPYLNTASTDDHEVSAVELELLLQQQDQGIDQIERDEELAHKLHEEELAEIARIQEEKVAQEEASRVAIMEMFNEVQAGIDADALFVAKLQQEEREEYTIEERAKFW
ncbi:hypothetical protein Tco_0824334 [Tanacetum coccineum]|uniref:Uncharacterized protein n=1 Tax=Tanacetum coccineum TaxID=301880 RepID=A0ABQ5AKJ0_9ASTR